MTWSEAQAKSGEGAGLFRFVFTQRVVFFRLTVVVIAVVGPGAAFAVLGSDAVSFDRIKGTFNVFARAQVTDSAARQLHGAIAQALGLA